MAASAIPLCTKFYLQENRHCYCNTGPFETTCKSTEVWGNWLVLLYGSDIACFLAYDDSILVIVVGTTTYDNHCYTL